MSQNISSQIDSFIAEQIAEWPQAAGNFQALANVKVKEIALPGWTIKVQFNPARIVSSAAKVDAASLAARKCFLCAENRSDVQRGIEWGGRYTILVNPFPIFPRHLTIPDTAHVDQLIDGRIADMIELAKAIEDYTVFYNGPRCGASAPDHMHFQAGNSDFLTIAQALEDTNLKEVATEGNSTLMLADELPIKMFVIDTDDAQEGAKLFGRLYAAIPVPEGEAEPMMNILCYTTPAGVRLAVIPRKKHRPSFYGTEGDDCILLSPASVDMGGVFITPRPEDFEKINAEIVTRIVDECCLNTEEIDAIAQNVQ